MSREIQCCLALPTTARRCGLAARAASSSGSAGARSELGGVEEGPDTRTLNLPVRGPPGQIGRARRPSARVSAAFRDLAAVQLASQLPAARAHLQVRLDDLPLAVLAGP